MRLVVASDFHLDARAMGVDRHEEIATLALETAQAAIDLKADAWLFLGDLCDPDSGPVVFRCAALAIQIAMYLSDKGITSHWLAGNHDTCDDGLGTTTLTPLRALMADRSNVHLYERGPGGNRRDGKGNLSRGFLLALPYVESALAYDPAEAVVKAAARAAELRDEVKVVISHLHVPGIVPGEETLQMARGREVMLPVDAIREHLPNALVLQGHFHKRQVHRVGGIEVQVVGSLARLTHGEEQHEPGYLVVDL